MAELVDALVSGTSGATLGSSSLLIRTTLRVFDASCGRLKNLSVAP